MKKIIEVFKKMDNSHQNLLLSIKRDLKKHREHFGIKKETSGLKISMFDETPQNFV